MNYIFFEDSIRNNLLPLTFTRPVSEIRIGILTIREKWEKYLNTAISNKTEKYLSKKFPLLSEKQNIYINSSVLPNMQLVKEISNLQFNEALISNNVLVALNAGQLEEENCRRIEKNIDFLQISNLWDIFSLNGEAIRSDYYLLTKERKSAPISKTNKVLGAKNIFIEKGARVECAVLNAETGPIYIGDNAEIMEGAVVRGPFALCKDSTVKLSAKIYGPTTIGPHSKVGGEINNSVFFGYSNKAHDGFLGNSVIGEWCNIGADTNNSNLKNNYADVKLWSYVDERFVNTGKQFCGLIMADHSKCGINTMFNTGTVVGVSANIFGSGFPRNFIPDFSWGGASGFTTHSMKKACETASLMMQRRNLKFDEKEKEIFDEIFKLTEKYRKY